MYSVRLDVGSGQGSNFITKTDYIDVRDSLIVNFSSDLTTGTLPLTVQFTDQSEGNPTSWVWDIDNDGVVDYTSQNPIHTYDTSGVYSVRLDVDNGNEFDFIVKGDYITVGNSLDPCIVGSVDTDHAYTVFVSGNYAYLAEGYKGLKIVDISNPTNPAIVGSVDTDHAYTVFVSGNYAYLAEASAGVKVIDISNPTNPAIVGSVDTYYTWKVFVSESYAYASDGEAGIKIINISNPTNPVIVDSIGTDGYVRGVYVSGNHAYIADGPAGLKIIQKDCILPCCAGIRGNIDYDPLDQVDISDMVYISDFIFTGGPNPVCFKEGDITGDGDIDISDMVYISDFIFTGGAAPVACP